MSLPILRESADVIRLFDPSSGEEVVLADAPTEMLAELRDLIRDAEEDQRLAKIALDTELLARMDRAASWTLRAGGFTLTAPSPAPVDHYDAHALRDDLEWAAATGLITPEAVEAAVQVIVDYKARAGGIKALLKVGGDLTDIIGRHHSVVERSRRVTVKKTRTT